MQTVTIQLVAGPPVIVQAEDVHSVAVKLEGGAQYVRFEVPGGIVFLNPAHVVSISATGA